MKLVIALFGLILLLAVVLAAAGMAWRQGTAREAGRVLAEPLAATAQPSVDALASVPPPVQRYLALVLPSQAMTVRTVTVAWQGEFRMKADAPWKPFDAVQQFSVLPPGFVWDASITMAPGVPVRVRDSYGAGHAGMRAAIGGLVRVVDQYDTPGLAESALGRWVGEAAWLPWALLPRHDDSGQVYWTAVDDSAARVTVVDGDIAVSAVFRFSDDGHVASMSAERYRDVDGSPVATPFEGVYGEPVDFHGVKVPGSAEVAWLLPEGRFAYWRGRPVSIRFDP